jgi:hypothetical protein
MPPAVPGQAVPVGAAPLAKGAMLALRNPEVRKTWLEQGGGSQTTEAAVASALEWLAKHQNPDGHWSLHAFDRTRDCKKRCGQPGIVCDTAGTALALLPFLGNGETHLTGPHAEVIAKGLRWLIAHEGPDGRWIESVYTESYAHAIATIVLCEALTLSNDQTLLEPARRAVGHTLYMQDVDEQDPEASGGWRYEASEDGDTSITGWQLMSLRVARDAGIAVPEEAFTTAMKFLDSMQANPKAGMFSYLPGAPVTPSMTAQGLLAREYAGWKLSHPALQFGVQYLLQKENLPDRKKFDLYYWFAASQVMRHVGGKVWERWNPLVRDTLLETQEKTGHQAGSWKPLGYHDVSGGRLYMTALGACTLQVYYRYKPLYPIMPAGAASANPPKPDPVAMAPAPAENPVLVERGRKKPVPNKRAAAAK